MQPPALAGAFRVLVIDNERPILEGMQLLLSGWGNTVQTATGLDEALEALAAADGKIDMILADYHLNNEDGISVIRTLRTRARRPIPAVLITADRTPAVADLAVAHDVHLLRKPREARGTAGGDVACGGAGGGVSEQVVMHGLTVHPASPERIGRARNEIEGGAQRSAACTPSMRLAAITAWVRLETLSFCRIAETCALMVASETLSS